MGIVCFLWGIAVMWVLHELYESKTLVTNKCIPNRSTAACRSFASALITRIILGSLEAAVT